MSPLGGVVVVLETGMQMLGALVGDASGMRAIERVRERERGI